MDWQQFASLAIVAVTVVLLVRSEWQRGRRAKLRACGNDCGCSTSSAEFRESVLNSKQTLTISQDN